MLLRCANGFGALAFTALGREPSFGAMLGDAPAEGGSVAGTGQVESALLVFGGHRSPEKCRRTAR